jgi:hypothetical protein
MTDFLMPIVVLLLLSIWNRLISIHHTLQSIGKDELRRLAEENTQLLSNGKDT